MTTSIQFNKQTGKFEGFHNGTRVCKGRSEKYIQQRFFELGIDATDNKNFVAVQEESVKFGINERFEFIEKFVKMVGHGINNSLIVSGPGGLGKTHTVINTLTNMGKTEMGIGDLDGDYVVIRGYSTAKAMYRNLFENNGKIVIFDDCDSVLKDPIASNILKAALDSYDKRVITWGAEFSKDEDLPNRFEFIGRVIFISNLAVSKLPQAIVSRSLKCDVTMTLEEKVERIATIVMQDDFMSSCDFNMKKDVIEFLKANAHKATDLNIRTAMNVCKCRYHDDDGSWQRMALYMMVA